MSHLTYITEEQVKSLLTWPEVFESVDMAFRSVCNPSDPDPDEPVASQPPRSLTFGPNQSGILFAMPGFVGNYKLPQVSQDKVQNTLACKLVTSFEGNRTRDPPLPTILATILLMSAETGKLEAIVEGTEITRWRTAAASLVATQTLFFNRPSIVDLSPCRVLSIVGCGVQGEIHAVGFACLFAQFKEIRFYNRTTAKRDSVVERVREFRPKFKNYDLILTKSDTVASCVQDADIIVIATNSSIPLIRKEDLKADVHINGEFLINFLTISHPKSLSAIGAGRNHHSELHPNIYEDCKLYPDNWESARTELAGIFDKVTGIVGEVIRGIKPQPNGGITVFQSLGMAVEDATVAQMVLNKFKQSQRVV